MKRASLTTLILCALMATKALAEPQEMDQELSALADKLAGPIKECGKKKVTVLDFTDLQGSSSGELGKYIAEQLSVDLVMSKRDFSVLDRANLKSILAEHKLTATGLVDPENAKKLGQFAGVDVLILGTIIPKNNHVSLTAKIITTDTAEIIGAARADFKSDETVKALMEKPSTENQTVFSQPKKSIASKQFGNLNILVEGLRKLDKGEVQVDFIFQNKSSKDSIAVALAGQPCFTMSCPVRGSLTDVSGMKYHCDEGSLSGVKSIVANPKNLTEVEANGDIKASVIFSTHFTDRKLVADDVASYRLQLEVVINAAYKASAYNNYRPVQEQLPPNCKTHNLVLDLPAP